VFVSNRFLRSISLFTTKFIIPFSCRVWISFWDSAWRKKLIFDLSFIISISSLAWIEKFISGLICCNRFPTSLFVL